MELKKGYKQTEAGVIPEDWDAKQIETLTPQNKKYGIVDGPFGSNLKTEHYRKSGIPIITSGYVTEGQFVADEYLFVDLEKFKEEKRSAVNAGDIVMAKIGARCGASAILPANHPESILSGNALKISIDEKKFSTYYVWQVLWNLYAKGELALLRTTGAQPAISMANLKKFHIPLPPTKAEQIAIAAALKVANTLIQSLEKLIAKKRNIKQGAMQEMLKPKEGWVVKKLGEVAVLKARIGWQGLTTAEYKETGDYYLITGTDFKNGFIDWENCFYVDYQRYKQDKKIQIKEHDVLATKDGTIGKVAFIENVPKPATLNSGVFVIRSIAQSFHPEFFYYLLLSEHFTKFLSQLSAGSTINHLYQKDFVHFEFQAPRTIEEQTLIATVLSDMDAEIAALETKLVKYKQVKHGMMQELLTGKIRLLTIQVSEKPKATVTVMPVQIDSQKKKHNWEFNEAVVISVLTKAFGKKDYPLGRKRYTKLSYLFHRYAERKAEGYLKKAAGPYNPNTKYGGPEKIAQTSGYIKAHSSDKYTGFIAANNIDAAAAYFNKWYGPEALRWLEQFRYKDNDELELLTTVDMAVQDLVQSNKDVSVAHVTALIRSHNEWRAKLKRSIFSDDNIEAAIRLSEDLFRT